MVHFVFLVVLIIGGVNAYIYFYDKKAQKEELERDLERLERIRQEIESENTKVDVEFEHETRDLVLETLREMECEYGEGTEENDIRIRFSYQGEQFMIEADNDCFFINIYDLWWYHISTYCDVDEFAAMQKTINRINAHVNCTVLYTINQEAEEIGVHSKKNMLFVRQIPDLKGYLISTLNDFFKVQRSVMTEIEKCKVTEEQQ